MGQTTGISWCDHTANFWMGCVKVSPLCLNCYAERDSLRYGNDIFGADKRRIFVKGVWSNLDKWNKQAGIDGVKRRCFVMSFGDFFEDLKEGHVDRAQMVEIRDRAIMLMPILTNLEFLVLTKRISNVNKMVPKYWLDKWPSNIRLGISVGTQKDADRDIPRLLQFSRTPNFLSMEPLLEPVYIKSGLSMNGHSWQGYGYTKAIDWVITGGESGPGARVANPDWFRSLRDQCISTRTPFHFKQYGEFNEQMQRVGRKNAGRLLDGREWLEFPYVEIATG